MQGPSGPQRQSPARALLTEGRLAEALAVADAEDDAESALIAAWCARRLGDAQAYARRRATAEVRTEGDVARRVRLTRLVGWGAGFGSGGDAVVADDLPDALGLAEALVTAHPTHDDVWVVLHEVCERLGRPVDALAALRELTRREDASPAHLVREARACLGLRDVEAAGVAVARALARAPDDVDVRELAADIAVLTDGEGAAVAVARAASDTPGRVAIHAARWLAIGRPDDAAACVRAAEASGVDPVGTSLAAARLALWAGDVGGVRAALSEAARQAPEGRALWGAAAVLDGASLEGLSHLDEAARSLAVTRGGVRSWLPLDEVLVWVSEANRRAGRAGPALAAANRAMAAGTGWSLVAQLTRVLAVVAPLSPEATRHAALWRPVTDKLDVPRGVVDAGRVGPLRAALEAELAALGGNRSARPTRVVDGALVAVPVPPHPRALARATQLTLRTRPLDEVLAAFDALVARFPDAPTPLTYRGETLLWVGRADEAAACFERALALDRDTTWAWIGLGAAHLVRGRLADAEAVWAEGVDVLGFEGPTLFPYRGELAWRRGDLDEARRQLTAALRQKAGRLATWILAALVDADGGDAALAVAVDASVRRAGPGAWLDARAHADGPDAVARLRALLALMRGNRSSTLPGWVVGDAAPRFLGWDRPRDLALPRWADGPVARGGPSPGT